MEMLALLAAIALLGAGLAALATFVGQDLIESKSAGFLAKTKTAKVQSTTPSELKARLALVNQAMTSRDTAIETLWPLLQTFDPACPKPPTRNRYQWMIDSLDAIESPKTRPDRHEQVGP